MRWYWIVLLAIAGIVLLVALVGALLPTKHQAACRAFLPQPAAEVFAALTDIRGFTKWRTDLRAVELLPDQDGKRCWREISKFGPMDLRLEECVPDRKIVGRIVTADSPFGGTWTYRVEPRGDGTELTITENGEVYNVFFRAMSRFVFGHTAAMQAYLRQLGAKFGAAVTIEPGSPDPEPPKK
ncbi:MAG: SRPBCC family protein [Planctomycetota bacterium]